MEGNIRNNFGKKVREIATKLYGGFITQEFQKGTQWQELLDKLRINDSPAAVAFVVIVVSF
jgi:hypothetical protein